MTEVKLSYSILNAWASGKFEDAIGYYLGKDLPATPAMALGKLKHQIWANYIKDKKKLPPELGGGDLSDPTVEQKWEKIFPFNEDYVIKLRGIIDLEDEDIITDHKCGLTPATAYVDGFQLDYYSLFRPKAKLGQIISHNPYVCDSLCIQDKQEVHRCTTKAVKFLSQYNREQALEYIFTHGGELIEYLETNRLIKQPA